MCTYVKELPSMRVRKRLEMNKREIDICNKKNPMRPKVTWYLRIFMSIAHDSYAYAYTHMVGCNITYTFTWWNSWYMIHMHMYIHGILRIFVFYGTDYRLSSACTCRYTHIYTNTDRDTYSHICIQIHDARYMHVVVERERERSYLAQWCSRNWFSRKLWENVLNRVSKLLNN